jgi:hypothetical protein
MATVQQGFVKPWAGRAASALVSFGESNTAGFLRSTHGNF